MTLDERAQRLFEKIEEAYFENAAGDNINYVELIREALIEQDKITRKVAAEEVVRLQPIGWSESMISKTTAHAAIMNCRGGVE